MTLHGFYQPVGDIAAAYSQPDLSPPPKVREPDAPPPPENPDPLPREYENHPGEGTFVDERV
jgi:hypothetical protein